MQKTTSGGGFPVFSGADYFEIASSSKDTEYSLNPKHKETVAKHQRMIIEQMQNREQMSEKQLKRRNVERRRRNITMELKEENDRHHEIIEIETNATS